MAHGPALQPEPAPIAACTVSRDVQAFDLLIEDMEAILGESWGDLSFAEAAVYLNQPDARALEFVAVAMDDEDESSLVQVRALIQRAKELQIKVILIAEELSPIVLHQLLRLGADDFVPYPLPEGALHEAVERLRTPPPEPVQAPMPVQRGPAEPSREGVVLSVQGLAGGVGATTFAVNLAWELATVTKQDPPLVCILDFDLQFGSVATFLDLPRKETVFELWQNTATFDAEAFRAALLPFNDKLKVLTAPADMVPLDLVTSEDVSRVIEMARHQFDFVIIDMPSTIVGWTETVLAASQLCFALLELDMRSAQNALRLIRALKAEDLPVDKLRYGLNRSPRLTELSAKSRAKRLAESLGIRLELMLPDGQRQVTDANDHGLPLAETAPRNPLRKEIQKLAKSLHDLDQTAVAATR